MKILHVIETLAAEGGGGDRACFELARHQASLGHEVEVFCFCDQNSTPFEGTSFTIRRFQRQSRGKLRKALEAVCANVDVVHIHGAWRPIQIWARRASKRQGTPYFYQPHGLFSPERMRQKRWRKNIWFHLFEKPALDRASGVIVESGRDRSVIAEVAPGARLVELPCGGGLDVCPESDVPFDRRFPDLAGKDYLLYFGRIDFHKGVDLLVDAYARHPELHLRHPLAIVGPDFNKTKSKIRAQVDGLGLKSVIFHDQVTDLASKAALFDAAAAFILPSRDENFGITVLEALSRGCPVLVSTATAWDFLEAEGAGIVFAPDVTDVEAAMMRFINCNADERRNMAAAGKTIARRYDWHEIARSSVAFYSEATARLGEKKYA